MKHFLLILLFLNFYQPATAQIPANPQKKVDAYLDKALEIYRVDSAMYYVDKAVKTAMQTGNDSLIDAAYYHKALVPAILGDFDKTLFYLKKFDSVLSKHYHPYYDFRRNTLYAYAYSMKSNYDLSLKYNFKSLELAKKNKDPEQVADAYNNIGKDYMNLGDETNSYKFLKLADSIYRKIFGHSSYITYNNLSQVAPDFETTEFYSKKAYQLLDTTDLFQLATFYMVRAQAYQRHGHNDESFKAAKKSYELAKKVDNKLIMNSAGFFIGKYYYNTNRLDSAIVYLTKNLESEQMNLNNKMLAARLLSKAYEKQQKYKQALHYHKLYAKYNDSISAEKAKKVYAEFNVKYETAKKDKELADKELVLLRQKKRFNMLVIIGGFVLLVLVTVYQWFYYRERKKEIAAVKQLEKEKEINEMRYKFLGNITHEIRTPLTLIIGNLELASEHLDTKEKLKKYIKNAYENAKRVVNEANEILELLKLDKNKNILKPKVVPLKQVINRIVLSFKSLMTMKKIDLDFSNDIQESLKVKLDLDKLEKIINNIMSNAIKYSPSGSRIIVKAAVEQDRLVLKIKDFGPGIKASELEKIFERFYQTKDNSSVGGIGIGLSLAQEFARLMSGDIKAYSEPGKGSLFVLELPLETVEETATPSVEDKQSQKAGISADDEKKEDKKHSILIVEDNPEMNKYLSTLLCPYFNCYQAFDGEEALKILRNHKIDLITSDIMMPKMDGMTLLNELKKDEKLSHIPVIMITAKSLEEEKLKAFSLGINDYIIKPFSKNELLARVKNLLKVKTQWEQWLFKEKELLSETDESFDKRFLEKMEKIILENLHDENFKVSDLARQIGYSQRQLTRVVKKHTGLSPVQYILELRLQKAYAYIKSKKFDNLSEIRYKVGLNSPSYFNRKFKERFGINPRDLMS